MDAAQQPANDVPETLSWVEICERYPDQWVCLVEIDEINDTDFDFRTARVVGHGKSRRESLDQADPWLAQYEEFARYHTGSRSNTTRLPDGELLLLSPNLDGRLVPDQMPRDDVAVPAPPSGEPFISEPLTWEQICERFPNEWVCLVEMEGITDTEFEFRTARVVGYGKTRRQPLDQASRVLEMYDGFGHLFTGLSRLSR